MTRPTLGEVCALVLVKKYSYPLEVEEEKDGIRIHIDYYRGDDPELLGRIMQAAIKLRLDPRQIRANLKYDEGDSCPTCGYDSSFGIDVTFLFEPLGE